MKFQFVRYTKSRFLGLICWILVLNAIDALSTALLVLKLGIQGEINPLWTWVVVTYGVDAFFFIKLIYPTIILYFMHEYVNTKVVPLYFLQAIFGRLNRKGRRELFFRKWLIITLHIAFGVYLLATGSHIVHWVLIFCGVLK